MKELLKENPVVKFVAGFILTLIILQPFSGIQVIAHMTEDSSLELDSSVRQGLLEKLLTAQINFVENKGQIENDEVKYYLKTWGQNVYFTKKAVVIDLYKEINRGSQNLVTCRGKLMKGGSFEERDISTKKIERIVVGISFPNSQPAQITAQGLSGYKVNYFIGNNPQEWKSNISTYREIIYKELYPQIDLRFRATGSALKYQFEVQRGGSWTQIRIKLSGIKGLEKDTDGNLIIKTEKGEFINRRPYTYQEIEGKRTEVASNFEIMNDSNYGFKVGRYDPEYPLIIDPELVYSTYLGGSGAERGYGIAVDSTGAAYVTGRTHSRDFPALGPYQESYAGASEVFVTKFSPAGDSLVYSTYLGGSGTDEGSGIAVDGNGAVYVTGRTLSRNFPTLNPYQGSHAGICDVFVTKLSPGGDYLVYSTYLGGSDIERGRGIGVDGTGAAYIVGETYSRDFPALTYQPSNAGEWDLFVTKLGPGGDCLVYSTYLGGSSTERGRGIAVDGAGAAYVTGCTDSSDFPTLNSYQESYAGEWDLFVTKLGPGGDRLVYSTYLGGSESDWGHGIAVDGAGAAYVTGYTDSRDFPTLNPCQESNTGGHSDLFVTKLGPEGDCLIYSTYLGGSGAEEGHAIAVDGAGAAYVTGETYSRDFPTLNPCQESNAGDCDVFVSKLGPGGDCLVYSTYLGGSAGDVGRAIAVDSNGAAYVTGYTYSTDFLTFNSYQPSNTGDCDVFVTRLAIYENIIE